MALAALIREVVLASEQHDLPTIVGGRWKLANVETEGVEMLIREEEVIRSARAQYWPKLQRVLTAPRIGELLGYSEAVTRVLDGSADEVEFCREKLALPAEELNPQPLITGDDLKELGIPRGLVYRELLEAVWEAQLEQRVRTKAEAIALVQVLRSAI
jgi:hypothetical protein